MCTPLPPTSQLSLLIKRGVHGITIAPIIICCYEFKTAVEEELKTELSEDKESTILMLEDRNRALLYEVQELRRQLSLAPVKGKGAVTYYLIWPLNFIQLLYISWREASFSPSSGEEGGQGRSCPDDQSWDNVCSTHYWYVISFYHCNRLWS